MATMLMLAGEIDEAEQLTQQALSILEPQPPTLPLALAYKNRAYLHLMRGDHRPTVALAEKSLALAQQAGDIYTTMSAYETLGLCWLPSDYQRGQDFLEKTLALALEHHGYWRASSVFPNLIMSYIDIYRLERAEELIAKGGHFTADHDMATAQFAIQAWQALLLVYRGRWRAAGEIMDTLANKPGPLPASRIPALVALGRLRARRGEAGADGLLDEALALTHKMGNLQRLGLAYAARAEAAWLAGDPQRTLAEVRAIYDVTIDNKQPGFAAELAYWRWKAGDEVATLDWMLQPFVLQVQGDWRGAAAAWAALGCPYEQARALAEGDSQAQLAALAFLESLGARPMMDFVRHRLQALGVQAIPRGSRPSTKENPFQLTNRQMEILRLLTEHLTNAEIGERLAISAKTVDYHISAILAKLDVASRTEAAELARRYFDLY
jgi:DNA-binding CsgD family transcriptional regulator